MWKSVSEHFGKVWADQIAAVMYPGIPLRAIAVEHFAPDHQVALAAVLLDQLSHAVAALAVALGALDAQHIELALNIAEDDVTAGHEAMLHRYRASRRLDKSASRHMKPVVVSRVCWVPEAEHEM